MASPKIRFYFFLPAIVILGGLLRLLFLATPHMDSDQAVTGLMARHILGGEFPFFFYGQDYCGSIEAYLASTIFWLFGATRFTLNATICLESIFFILFIYFLARLIFGVKTGLLAALYTALPSYYLIFHSVLARAAYIEIPIIGVLLLLVGYKIIYCQSERKGLFFILGFLSGLGIWTHFLIIFFLPPIFLLWLFRDPLLWKKPGVFFVFAGLVLGGLPLWAHNTAHPLVTWHYLMGTAGGDEGAWESLKDFFLFRFPEALGVKNNDSEKFIIPYLSPAIYLLYLAVFVSLLILRRKGFAGFFKFRIEQSQGLDLLILFLFLFPLIFSFSGFAAAHTSRYLQPLFAVLPILLAVFTRKLKAFSPILVSAFLILHLSSNVFGTLTRLPLFSPKELQNFNQAR
ncbi:MAG TPA: glycosyltransferase family 39 protein, partial [Thermodesulfobacteriota bacterium]|nr:glycosyltransferase family 39 protein [Thermodesulfobacteriota bacterium]